MRPVTITLHDADFARLSEAAARRGDSLEDAAAELLRLALSEDARGRGLAVLDALDARQQPIDEAEAMRLAVEGVRAMRAERRAAGRL
jgi:hypothetical protein